MSAADSNLPSLTNVVLSLCVVLLVFLALAILLRRLNGGGWHSGPIKTVYQLPLGPKERLVVIEIAGKQHLLGVTSNNINYLFELDGNLAVKQAVPDNSPQAPLTVQALLAKWQTKSKQEPAE